MKLKNKIYWLLRWFIHAAKAASECEPYCDDCDEVVDSVEPMEDPWGGIHGYICEDCNERRINDYIENQYD